MATLIRLRGLQGSEAASGSGYTQNRGFRVKGTNAASLTTAMSGDDNDLTFTAVDGGDAGNDIRVRIVVSGASTPLSIAVAGNDITVNSATSAGSAATSTAAQVRDALNGDGSASALVSTALAEGNDGTGVVAAFAYTNLSGGTDDNAMVLSDRVAVVDVDDPAVRRTLRDNAGRWIENLTGNNTAVLRGLSSSEGAAQQFGGRRGFRVTPAAGGTQTLVNQGAATTVNLGDGPTRRTLRHYWKDYVPGASGSSLITIRGLDRSEASTQSGTQTTGLVSRGLTIRDQAGTPQRLSNTANIQVDLNDSYVRRILRRNRDKFVVVSAP